MKLKHKGDGKIYNCTEVNVVDDKAYVTIRTNHDYNSQHGHRASMTGHYITELMSDFDIIKGGEDE